MRTIVMRVTITRVVPVENLRNFLRLVSCPHEALFIIMDRLSCYRLEAA
jgi:hypothetical protein